MSYEIFESYVNGDYEKYDLTKLDMFMSIDDRIQHIKGCIYLDSISMLKKISTCQDDIYVYRGESMYHFLLQNSKNPCNFLYEINFPRNFNFDIYEKYVKTSIPVFTFIVEELCKSINLLGTLSGDEEIQYMLGVKCLDEKTKQLQNKLKNTALKKYYLESGQKFGTKLIQMSLIFSGCNMTGLFLMTPFSVFFHVPTAVALVSVLSTSTVFTLYDAICNNK